MKSFQGELTHVASLMAQQGKKMYYLSLSEPAHREVNGPTPNFHAAGQGHNSPGQQP